MTLCSGIAIMFPANETSFHEIHFNIINHFLLEFNVPCNEVS